FQTAYGPHHQLAATLRADAFRAAPDNAAQPAGLIPVYTTGLMLSAARSCQLPTQRVGTRKTASGVTFYDTLPPRVSQKPLSRRERGWGEPGEGLGRGDQKIST
ncbi:hypothetical protein, partial [Candidatus Thiosymbion oneisti]|uniref:hypothetical protein n=1 Tax=Candidatus Thiosymbion oneisti TaxID=589554 RepID=UPI001C406E54